jgi:glycosyltransferase involved in cell wall biosynthesis
MKIAILNNCVPFVAGGAEHLADSLCRKLKEYGHEALLVRIPFAWQPSEKVVEHILAARLIRLTGVDRLIGLKFPAYYVPHEDKMLWLLHQFRQAYDLWGTPYQDIPDTPEGHKIRSVIIEADNRYLREARKIYTISPVVGERLKKFNDIDSEVLYHPLGHSDHFFCSRYGDYMFCPSRVTGGKRQALAVEAMKYVKSGVRLVIAGQPELPSDRETIERLIRENKLESRVEFIPRFIAEDEKALRFADALACIYTPYDEDSYGYVTLEAYHSRKPVITCRDSGATTILVRDGQTGFVTAPSAPAIAEAMDNLYEDRRKAQ